MAANTSFVLMRGQRTVSRCRGGGAHIKSVVLRRKPTTGWSVLCANHGRSLPRIQRKRTILIFMSESLCGLLRLCTLELRGRS